MPNAFVPLGPGASFDEARSVLNANFAQLDSETVTKVFRRASGNAFIQGKLPGDIGYGFLMYDTDGLVVIACYVDSDGQPILKIAKDGFDALTASDDELILNSAQNVLKVVQTGTAVINRPGSANDFADSIEVTHDLGYLPVVIAFVNPPSGYASAIKNIPLPFFDYALFDSANAINIRGWHINGLADISGLTTAFVRFRLAFVNGDSGQTGNWTFRYYLLQETAN